MTGIHTASAELYRLFEILNLKFWGGKLPAPQITIQKADSRSILGWCTVAPVCKPASTNEPARYEINLVAENLARSPHEIAATLLHEMVHLANLNNGKRDCTGNQYHNQLFKEEAERVWLLTEKYHSYGYAITRPSEQLLTWLGAQPLNPLAFQLYRASQDNKPPRGTKGRMIKYTCGCTIVRCATELVANCCKCGHLFIKA